MLEYYKELQKWWEICIIGEEDTDRSFFFHARRETKSFLCMALEYVTCFAAHLYTKKFSEDKARIGHVKRNLTNTWHERFFVIEQFYSDHLETLHFFPYFIR